MSATFRVTDELIFGAGGAEADCLCMALSDLDLLDDEEISSAVLGDQSENKSVTGSYTALIRSNGKQMMSTIYPFYRPLLTRQMIRYLCIAQAIAQ